MSYAPNKRWLVLRRIHSAQYFNHLLECHKSLCHWCGEPVIRWKHISRHASPQFKDGWVTYVRRGKKTRVRLATIDHVVPLSQGGSAEWPNLVLACWKCNNDRNVIEQANRRDTILGEAAGHDVLDGDWEREALNQLRAFAQQCAHIMNRINQRLANGDPRCGSIAARELYDACEQMRDDYKWLRYTTERRGAG